MNDNPVVCLCWNCGREIHKGEGIYDVNNEKWCSDCVSGCYTFPDDEPNYDNET